MVIALEFNPAQRGGDHSEC